MTTPEEWRPIPGHDGYEVSNLGRVLSRRRPVSAIKAQHVRKDGYAGLALHCGPAHRTRLVHHLVAEAFLGARPEGMVVRHLNGDRLDNRAENMSWGTYSENNLDAVAHGTHHWAAQTHCPQGHPYSEDNTRITQRGRHCRTCERARQAIYNGRRPERLAAKARREAA